MVLSSVPGEEIPDIGFDFSDKLAHFLEYLVLGVFLLFAFKGEKTLVWGGIFAVIEEMHQFYIPGRECSAADLVMNLLGLVVSPAVFRLLVHLRKRRSI
ncbi:MAG: VanZ family protein [Candidatus Thorarchaeota archaeon SMTZ1-83]